jgi:hypothetical protein
VNEKGVVMRRLLAAGAAIVVCLALGGVPVAAQEWEGVTVTATQECEDLGASPIVCSWTASDPRLTGTLTHDQVGLIGDGILPEPPEAALSWLDGTLDGPEGSWTARLYLGWTYPMSLLAVLSGTGAYEGWHYIAWSVDENLSDTVVDWTGMLYEGELSPLGPLEPPAE